MLIHTRGRSSQQDTQNLHESGYFSIPFFGRCAKEIRGSEELTITSAMQKVLLGQLDVHKSMYLFPERALLTSKNPTVLLTSMSGGGLTHNEKNASSC